MAKRIYSILLLGPLFLAACGDAEEPSAQTAPATEQQQATSPAPAAEPVLKREDYMLHYEVTSSGFDSVVEFIKLAISDRGIKINNVSYIGNMLERTKEAVGASKTVYPDGQAQAIEFCSSTISRATMEADPHNIVFCPYVILVYTIPEQPDVVHVSYRRPLLVGDETSKASLKAVEELVDGIIKEAIQ
jgi:hypothetical protein